MGVHIALTEVLPMTGAGELVKPGDMMVVNGVRLEAMAVGNGFFMSKMPDGEWRSFDVKDATHAFDTAVLDVMRRCFESGKDSAGGKTSFYPEYYADEMMRLIEERR